MKMRVVRVTTTEFELEDGRVYTHITPLDPVPTPEEFQVFYDKWDALLKETDVERSGQSTKSR